MKAEEAWQQLRHPQSVRLDEDTVIAHMVQTYLRLRLTLACIALALPAVLFVGNRLYGEAVVEPSISAYYYTPMQAVFVGALIIVGLILIIYEGSSPLEDGLLNAAGVFVWIVALVPTAKPKPGPGSLEAAAEGAAPLVHLGAAILFFACIALVCWTTSKYTLRYIADDRLKERYRRIYTWTGWLLVGLPALIVLLILLAGRSQYVFGLEVAALYVFAGYWIAKSLELRTGATAHRAGLEKRLLEQAQRR